MDEEKIYRTNLLEEEHYMDERTLLRINGIIGYGDKNHRVKFFEEHCSMKEHMKWVIKKMVESYEEQNSDKFKSYKKNLSSLRAIMNSRDRVISEDQRFHVLNFF